MVKVLVDTCVWAAYFSRPQSNATQTIDELLDDHRVVLISPVLAEVLRGIKNKHQADFVASQLEGVHWELIRWQDWKRAAEIARNLASQGKTIPLTDLTISAIALDRGFEVYTSDPHFDLIPELKLFRPK